MPASMPCLCRILHLMWILRPLLIAVSTMCLNQGQHEWMTSEFPQAHTAPGCQITGIQVVKCPPMLAVCYLASVCWLFAQVVLSSRCLPPHSVVCDVMFVCRLAFHMRLRHSHVCTVGAPRATARTRFMMPLLVPVTLSVPAAMCVSPPYAATWPVK